MTLNLTLAKVQQFCRNPSEFAKRIWAELVSLDSRTTSLESSAGVDITTITGDVTFTAEKVGSIGADKVTADMINHFISTEQTGNGSAQNVAHGLGTTPTSVLIIPSLNKDGADCSFTFTKGSTNVVVTATSGAKYYVFAIK